jgi:polysaccharide chain length determinant protein (PEP-CTERM system associated)
MTETNLPPQITEEEGDPSEIVQRAVRIVLKGRWWILLTGLGALGAAVIALSFVPNVYRSEATILVVEQQIPQNLVASLSSVTGTQKLQAMTQEVLSRASLLGIIEKTQLFRGKNLPPDAAVERFRKAIDIEPTNVTREGSFNAFVISFSASTPELAQEVTRLLSALFIERHSETRENRAKSTTTFLNDRLTEKRKHSADVEQQIRDFKARYAGTLPESRVANESQMAEIRTQLQGTITGMTRAKQQRVVWESMLSGNLNGRLTKLKTERAAVLARFTPKHPDVIKRDEEIAQLERALASFQAGAGLSEETLARLAASDPVIGQLHGQIEANRLEVENLVQDQKRLEAAKANLQRQLNLTPVLEQQLAGLTREAESLHQEIAKLEAMDQQSALSADMDRRQQGEQFRQLEFPSLPGKPASPPRLKISAGACVGGLVLGFIVAFLLDIRKGCFQTEQQIRRKFSPPLVLSIPELPTARELRERKRRTGLEWVAGSVVVAVMAAIELYVYKFP